MQISCIIPTRNRREMVCHAIQSVMSQRQAVSEIIVVDDGSVDGSQEIITERFPDVILAESNGLGAGFARNRGVELCRGDILMFLDSDDEWLPEHSEKLLAVLAAGHSVAYGTTLTLDQINGGAFLIPDSGEGCAGECLSKLLRWCFLVPSSIGMRREAFFRSNGFSSVAFGEDWLFFLNLARSYSFGFAGQEPITRRYLHPGSLCAQVSRDHILTVLTEIREKFLSAEKITDGAVSHFNCMLEWTRGYAKQWGTVQEWYSDLKREGLV